MTHYIVARIAIHDRDRKEIPEGIMDAFDTAAVVVSSPPPEVLHDTLRPES